MEKPYKRPARKASGGFVSALLRLVTAAFCCYLLVSLVTNQVDIMVKNQQIASLQQQIEQQRAQTTELERLLGSNDDIGEYYEKIAREKLGYAYPDEQIFMDITGQ